MIKRKINIEKELSSTSINNLYLDTYKNNKPVNLPVSRCEMNKRVELPKLTKFATLPIKECTCETLERPSANALNLGGGVVKITWPPVECARGYVIAKDSTDNIIFDSDNGDVLEMQSNGNYYILDLNSDANSHTYYVASILDEPVRNALW